jgi:cobalt-precorrin-6B (C15)-methyltransferase
MRHIRDKEFIRGSVPMTKEEVRAVSVAKLQLEPHHILVDVGAGTGSVGIEAAGYLPNGKVFGIEINPDGIDIIKKNIEKFNLKNYSLIEGLAPESIPDEKYNRMFVGGSKGNLDTIVEHFMKHSAQDGVIVINAIVLETLTKAMETLKANNFEDIEVVSMTVARNRKVGSMNMMMGENPIYIITARRGE